MSELITGIGMLLFFLWSASQGLSPDFEQTSKWYAQLGISGAGGLYILLPYLKNFDINNVLKFFKTRDSGTDSTVPPDQNSFVDKSKRDFECLIYLRDRCGECGCKDGVELVNQLNTLLFKCIAAKKG